MINVNASHDTQPASGDAKLNRRLALMRSYPQRQVTALEALEALAKWDGDTAHAAAELETSPNMVMAALVSDPTAEGMLARYLKAYTQAKTFGLINELALRVSDTIDELPPREAAKALTSLIGAMSQLTANATSDKDNDPLSIVSRALPGPQRDAVLALAKAIAAAPVLPETYVSINSEPTPIAATEHAELSDGNALDTASDIDEATSELILDGLERLAGPELSDSQGEVD